MYWIGEVFFNGGKAWATDLVEMQDTPDGRKQWDAKPICLGREADILPILKQGKSIPADMDERRKAVLEGIIERGEHVRIDRSDTTKPLSTGKLRAIKVRDSRIRPTALTQYKPSKLESTKIQRISNCLPQPTV